MLRSARMITAALLVAVFAVLAVPLGFAAVPTVVRALEAPEPTPVPTTPDIQLPPTELTPPAVVGALEPAAPAPEQDILTAALNAELILEGPGEISAIVLDADSGENLFERGPDNHQLPASNQKLLTAAAAMSKLDPTRRLTTAVVAGDRPSELVLVAGGDVLLTAGTSKPDAVVGHAGLQTLAEETLAALDPADSPFTVTIDDTLFVGPTLNAGWLPGDIAAGEIAPIYPLAINSSWIDETASGGPRSPDAALAAATAFRDALALAGGDSGLEVAVEVTRSQAPAEGGDQLAAVDSATIAEQVQHMLLTSDNYLAETLARLAARASGQPASFGGATETIDRVLGQLAVPTESLVVSDAAGLSPRNEVSPAQLAAVVRAMVVSDDPALASALAGLPVAGLSGTLQERYADTATAAGAGLVRAKTGTLNAVTALSGYVVTAEGRLLVFSFIASGLDGNTGEARAVIDRAAAALAACGCR
ncbi:D-alanyl-D-alanine carboxypeptidase/D-alanyl-D-alanine-endopeptidase [Arthrobacter sp. AET 35A]|nr:D-alanyl-D-alanine carboxypeptidase/D-alanyl-D-alanine-endopeptidase [Arthrobacter sp. AET 35A]